MKNLVKVVLAILCSISMSAQSINVMTYNLRYDNPNDGENSWPNRKEFLLSQIKFYEADIFGTQEGLEHQVEYLNENLDNHSFIGVGRDEGSKGEYSALFFDHKKFQLIEGDTFWLSETPDIPSKGWDASLNRICTYAILQNLSNELKIMVFNTHFDHRGDLAREKSAQLILKKIEILNKDNLPVILMGDFNLRPEQEPIIRISKFLNDSKLISNSLPFGPEATFGGFDICQPNKYRIDYIFTSKENIIVNKYAVLVNVENNKYPSDHFPVYVNITIVN